MIKGHRIEKKISVEQFLSIIKNFDMNDYHTTDHTFFRIKEKERKIFKDKIIKEYLLGATPNLVGLQYNENYAVFYKYGKDTLRIILNIEPERINIVTFYIIDNNQKPRI